MPISSLLVTLDQDPHLKAEAQQWLDSRPAVTTGPLHGQRLPVVLDTVSLDEGRELVEQMGNVRGIAFVDVLSINFEDTEN